MSKITELIEKYEVIKRESRAEYAFVLCDDIISDLKALKDSEGELLEALRGMLNMYTQLINSGDCGNWNPEEQNEVIIAREAINKALNIKP